MREESRFREGWPLEAVSCRIQSWDSRICRERCAAAMCTGDVAGRNVCHGYSGGCVVLWKDKTPAAPYLNRGIAAKCEGVCGGDA